MSVLLDARPVAAAVIDAVSTAIANSDDSTQRAYDRAGVPGTNRNDGEVPVLFAQVDVERRFEESSARFGAPSGSTAWRVIVAGVGQTVDEVAWVLAKVMGALEDVSLTLADGHDFICRHEDYRSPVFDDGSFWGSVTFTCAT
jgi:hypothetical protein